MQRDDIERRWPELKTRIADHYGDIPEEDLERAHGARRELLMLIAAQYGRTGPQADEELDRIMKGQS